MGRGGRGRARGAEDEQALIGRAAAGDASAFAQLVETHKRLLEAACATAVLARAEREDALQQALIDIWRGLPGFHGEAKLSTWMFRVAQNAARRHARRGLRVVPTVPEVHASEVASRADDWDDAVVTKTAVIAAIEALPEDHREALLLHTQAGMSMQEIADLKYAAIGTVKAWIHRARADIARSIEQAER